jgi:hypothetical protein
MNEKDTSLDIKVVPWAASQETIAIHSQRLIRNASIQERLKGTRYRLLSTQPIEPEKKSENPVETQLYRTTIYDYTNNRTLIVEGQLDQPETLTVEEFSLQPLPSEEEFEAATKILLNDPEIGPAIREQRVIPYRPMPPLVEAELPHGAVERTLAVGLFAPDGENKHRIVGVNMIRDTVVREVDNVASPSRDTCGALAGEGCPSSGNAGQVRVTVSQGFTVLWHFMVTRPAASSGTNGSGIELGFVDYRGKRVLYKAHVPILNVEYFQDGVNAGCGPTYRDWQNSETCFEAIGTDIIPGFRLCSSPAKTLLDSGTDKGNFRGVGIYVEGQEAVLVSEMQAGWYRYISEWRFHADGTIRPRFGFSAVNNPCTCKVHHHNAYWRLDFDIRTPGNNIVEEFNDPPLFMGMHWHKKMYEIRRAKDSARHRKWRVSNAETGEGYELIPGASDGAASNYGAGDLWVLKYHGGEIDDGQGFTTDPAKSTANLDKFLNGEVVEHTDVVLWYAAHFLHDASHAEGHIVGPELKPFKW